MNETDIIVHGQEAFQHAEAIADRFTGHLVHQGLIDLLGTSSLLPTDFPLYLDLLKYARCLEAIYADRTRIAALASCGAQSPIGPGELRSRIEAAEALGAIKRGAEAFAHCESLPEGPVRELERFGLGVSAELLEAAVSTPPVDFAVHARMLECSFRKIELVKLLAEGKEPTPFI